MFERFTAEARAVVIGAQAEARTLGHTKIGTEHVLLALLGPDVGEAAYVLRGAGLTVEDARARVTALTKGSALGPDDAEALRAIGIDLDAVLARVEQNFGVQAADLEAARQPEPRKWWQLPKGGHIPFSPRAKKVLELSLREAVALRSRELRPEHILLGLLREGEGLAARVMVDAGLNLKVVREDVLAALA
ncbi:Clp protease N-terminal domain-containing protein [Catenuloplanes japonicus]|uniref:Clp protease N-terminal domain-containing protein n=1 Tax=Catenuloplanes japonicus TaxID=33876 RepID=UPI0005277C78|nr:Clp protease N-terminal domain-containing protein [Catenuloplanes japonicus]